MLLGLVLLRIGRNIRQLCLVTAVLIGKSRHYECVGSYRFCINDLGSEQTRSTKTTITEVTHLLNYMATHPDAKVRFYKSDMILHIHSDGSYLSALRSLSRVGGYFYLSSATPNPASCAHNGAIYVLSRILKRVLASAAEVEIGSTFTNTHEALPIRQMLRDMGQPKPAMPMKVDNTTAVGFANSKLKYKRSKSIDMN